MLAELRDDNKSLTSAMREVHNACDEYGDVATASLLEVWIDETSGEPGSFSRPRAAVPGRTTDRTGRSA